MRHDGRSSERPRKRRWRDYRTGAGGRPVKDFLDTLSDVEVAAIVDEMKNVSLHGLAAAKHLRGDLYEIRADAPTRSFRLLFAMEGHHRQVLLALSSFVKKTQKTPLRDLEVAEDRLVDWRRRATSLRA